MAIDWQLFLSAIFVVVVGGSIALPRIMSGKKRDGLDQNFAEAQQKMLADMQALFAQQLTALSATNDAQQLQIDSMQGIAGKIQAPAANVTTNTDRHDTVTTLSGTGTMGSGAYSVTDDHSVTTPAPVVVTPVTPTVPVVVVPDTVINQPVVVPDVIAVTPTVLAPVVVPDTIQIVPVLP